MKKINYNRKLILFPYYEFNQAPWEYHTKTLFLRKFWSQDDEAVQQGRKNKWISVNK